MRKFIKPLTVTASLVMLFLTSACGNSATTSSSTASPAASVKPAATDATAAADTVKTITHELGTTEIKGTPKRVVTLEWAYAEDLLALGIQPIGSADKRLCKLG